MRVHAVAQGQLGNAAAVLPAKVVGYGVVILRSMCEGLERRERKEIYILKKQRKKQNWHQMWKHKQDIENVLSLCNHKLN